MSVNDVMKGMINTELQKHINLKTEGAAIQRSISSLDEQIIGIQQAGLHSAQQKILDLEGDLLASDNYYKNLLSRPMHEIAAKNGNFKKTYEEQQRLMAEWMVSQKAFKELAIQFGQKLGKTPQEVIKEGLDKKIDVLENRHDKEHNSNADDGFFDPYRESLKEKYYNERKPKA